jgi:hypothetical protein
MPRYLAEPDFAAQPIVPQNGAGSLYCRVETRHRDGGQMVWIHIRMGKHRQKSYCIYDALSPEAVLLAAG